MSQLAPRVIGATTQAGIFMGRPKTGVHSCNVYSAGRPVCARRHTQMHSKDGLFAIRPQCRAPLWPEKVSQELVEWSRQGTSGRIQIGIDTREDLTERIAGRQGETNAPRGYPDLCSDFEQ